MPKWKVESVPDVVEGLVRHYVTDGELKFQIAQGTAVANQLSSLLNNLEEQNAAMQEERRWRKIGREWPEDGQWCQMLSNSVCPENFYFNASVNVWGNETDSDVESDGKSYRMGCTFTHWRPAPADVQKEEV